MFCIHHVTLGYMFECQCKLKILTDVSPKGHLGICRHMQHKVAICKMFFIIVLRKPV